MLVLLILAGAVCVVYVRVEALIPHWALRAAIRQVSSTIAFARAQAVIEGRPMVLRYKLDTLACEVLRLESGRGVDRGQRLRHTRLSGNVEMQVRMADGAADAMGQSMDITCQPAGTLTPHEVVLVSAGGETSLLSINPLTGRVRSQFGAR